RSVVRLRQLATKPLRGGRIHVELSQQVSRHAFGTCEVRSWVHVFSRERRRALGRPTRSLPLVAKWRRLGCAPQARNDDAAFLLIRMHDPAVDPAPGIARTCPR